MTLGLSCQKIEDPFRYSEMKKKKHIILTLLLLLPIFTIGIIALRIDYFLDVAGEFLVIADQPDKCDVVFVPSGNPKLRFPKAIKLLKEGLADKIIIILEKQSARKKAFQHRYGDRFSKRAMIEHIIRVEGIDRSKVIIPSERSRSTSEDFALLKSILKKEKTDSIIITTAWYHLRRCKMVAGRVLGDEIKTYFVPADFPDKNSFISRHKRILAMFTVYLKLAYYYVAK